jgi:uncharacterized protein (DUF1501 family)
VGRVWAKTELVLGGRVKAGVVSGQLHENNYSLFSTGYIKIAI